MSELLPEQLLRICWSLDGLSVGDALGEQLFDVLDLQALSAMRGRKRPLPPGYWKYTDDTQMALSLVEVLVRHGEIDQNALAQSFATRFEPERGYGPAMYDLLPRLLAGERWETAAYSLFEGRGGLSRPHCATISASLVRDGIQRAQSLANSASIQEVVHVLGNGADATAQDTVPYVLWCAARELDNYAEGIWLTASGLGDIDTNCAGERLMLSSTGGRRAHRGSGKARRRLRFRPYRAALAHTQAHCEVAPAPAMRGRRRVLQFVTKRHA